MIPIHSAEAENPNFQVPDPLVGAGHDQADKSRFPGEAVLVELICTGVPPRDQLAVVTFMVAEDTATIPTMARLDPPMVRLVAIFVVAATKLT